MMPFEDIIVYQEKLRNIVIQDVFLEFIPKSNKLLADLDKKFISDSQQELISFFTNTQFRIPKLEEALAEHINDINSLMLTRTPGFYLNDYDLYKRTILEATPYTYLSRRLEHTAKTHELIKARLSTYVSWHLPTMQLFPGNGEFTDLLVSGDPLYLVDIDSNYLTPVKQKYTQQYQDRLRYYVIESDSDLPRNLELSSQLGFVFAWSFFNYRTRHLIKHYASRIFEMLRPGGVVMFSYNNCERPQCYKLFQDKYAAFITKTELVKDLIDLGYEIIATFDEDSTISWIEVKKPGELTSNRAGQTLASIINVKENK